MAFLTAGISQALARHGRNLELTYNNKDAVYNPVTGQVTSTSTPPVQIRGYFYDSQKQPADETLISLGRRRLIFRPFDTSGNPIPKPNEGDTITGQRDAVNILRIDEIVSGETTLMYICWVRE